ncbi:MAG: NADP-dependent oxidoreductase [Rhodospirillaceae bacterium]|nr:NADP-dependent oxidoreductase [Rhodospirillaceae bacterium]MDE0617560.1 NADP-dependent oxidoreductase [Rhodospirillaceae bacterium]
MTLVNRQWLLAERPAGMFDESNFRLVETPVPEPGEGEILIHNIWLSVDPYMRGRMNAGKSYAKPVEVGAVMEGGTVGEVVASNHPDFRVGDIVEERLGWQEYGVTGGRLTRRIDPALAPVSTAVGVLGMPGMTAYFGTKEVMSVKAGDTVVVSAASGAVGGLVGQIARIEGAAQVVGIAGGEAKCGYCVDELGYDACLDYRRFGKDSAALGAALAEACPDGIDGYFDNVGGWISDAVYPLTNPFGRVAICGMISEYNLTEPERVPRYTRQILTNRLRVTGFIVTDFWSRWQEGLEAMAGWIAEGRIRYREDVEVGIENAPRALLKLFRSENFGKQLVRLRDDPTV